MNDTTNTLFSDKVIRFSSLLSLLIFLGCSIFIIMKLGSLPPNIPLYNQLMWGKERLAPKFFIFLPLGICFIFFLLNAFLMKRFYLKAPLLSRIIAITTFLCVLLSCIFIVRATLLIS